MKYFAASTLAVLLALCGNQRCVGEETSSELIGPTDYEHLRFTTLRTYCGGLIYTALGSFYLDYKLDTNLTASEFCVWAFQPANESQSFNIRYNEFPTSAYAHDGVMVYTWSKNGFQEFELPRDKTRLFLTARVVFVALSTFPATRSERGKGFSIAVDGKFTFTGANANFVDKPEGEFSYPVGKTHYDNNEYFALVVQTQKNRNPTDILKYKHIQLTDVDTEEGVDVVEVYEIYQYVYGFVTTPGTTFKQITSLSGKHEGPVVATASLTPYPYIVLFKSDKNVTGTGFTVRWKTPEWLE